MWARYKVGEPIGPYIVESVELEPLSDGEWMERCANSGRTVLNMIHRTPEPPREFELPEVDGDTMTIIPFVPNYKFEGERNPLTVAGAPDDAIWVNVEGSPCNYWSLLKTAWKPNHDLFLIEHDVKSSQAQRDEIAACSEPWCLNNYCHFSEVDREAWKWGVLGHTRFRRELIEKMPDLVNDLEPRWHDWHETSTGIGMVLREAGYVPHEHLPYVHHHRMDEGRCESDGCDHGARA